MLSIVEPIEENPLEEFHSRMGRRFARAEPRRRALVYMRGLLGPVERRNGWQLAASGGEDEPDGMQRLLNSARWDADGVRDDLRDFVVERAGDPSATVVLDEIQFPKKGTHSVGVARQYSKLTGRTENCQTGLFLSYNSRSETYVIDRELYLPRSWAADARRRRAARVPDGVRYRSKPELAWLMAQRLRAAQVPMGWLAAPSGFGSDQRLRVTLERVRIRFVLGVRGDERLPILVGGRQLNMAAESLPAVVPPDSWTRLHGIGQAHVWTRVPIASTQPGLIGRWLLLRRNPLDARDRKFYICSTDRATPLAELARVASQIEANLAVLARLQNDVGLDQYEVRQWVGWHRYMTLGLAAAACRTLARRERSYALCATPRRRSLPERNRQCQNTTRHPPRSDTWPIRSAGSSS